MKKTIKAILLVAATLIILIPSFVLVFQLARTSPEVYMGETEITPAFVSWSVINSDGEEVITSMSLDRAEKEFEKADKLVVTLEQIKHLTFQRPFLAANVAITPMQESENQFPTMSYAEFQASDITITEPVQVVLVVLWEITEGVRVKAAYSFEVYPL